MSRLEPLPYYRWHWRDYRANRKVQRLLNHHVPRGLYRDLLDEQWAEGFIPGDDLEALADICFCPLEVIQEHWKTLRHFFRKVDENVWVNDRMDRERTGKDAERVKRAIAGEKGGKTKASKGLPRKDELDFKANASTCHIEGALAEHEHEHKHKHEQEQRATPEPSLPEPHVAAPEPIVIVPDEVLDEDDDISFPEGFDDLTYGRLFWEKLSRPYDRGTLEVTASAIRLFSLREHVPMHKAAMQFLARANLAIVAGDKVNRFWFTDGEHTKDTEKTNGQRTKTDQRRDKNREAITAVLGRGEGAGAMAGSDGPDVQRGPDGRSDRHVGKGPPRLRGSSD